MAWISNETLRLERQESEMLTDADLNEGIRTGLWRIQAQVTWFVGSEAGRHYAHYRPTFLADLSALGHEPVRIPSPLLDRTVPFVRTHFEIDADLVLNLQGGRDLSEEARAWLANQRRHFWGEALGRGSKTKGKEPLVANPGLAQRSQKVLDNRLQQREINDWEANVRNIQTADVQSLANMDGTGVEVGNFVGLWLPTPLGHEPFLTRVVRENGETRVQGIWLEWPALRRWLLDGVADLFPSASLRPATVADGSRAVAGIPIVLEPGVQPPVIELGWTATRTGLALAWAAIVLGLLVAGWVLGATVAWGERRARFVSAVTHELRTPLTTFRMYAQMLSDGMVREPKKQAEYLETLRQESDRLGRVVESVLLHSRLEGERVPKDHRVMSLTELVEEVLPPLSSRAAELGMELVPNYDPAKDVKLRVDPQAIEQVLLNLVDNSGKYAATASDRRLHLDVRVEHRACWIEFRDHGDGIPTDVAPHLFEPYRRSRLHEAGPLSGIGLGLTLSRDLTRGQGGDLVMLPGPGAAFRVILPLLAGTSPLGS